MKLKEVAPTVAFAAGFAGRADETHRYVFFANGRVCASSGNDGATWEAPAELDGVAVPAEQLSKLLDSLAADHEDVTFTKTKARVVVKAGKFSAQLPMLAAADWPGEVSGGEAPAATAPLSPEFWAAFDAVNFTTGPQANPVQGGVFWAADGTLITYDGKRITAAPSGVPCPAPGEGVLIPSRFVKLTKYGFTGVAVDAAERLWFVGAAGAAWTVLVAVQFPVKACFELIAVGRSGAQSGTRATMPGNIGSVLDRLLASSTLDSVRVEVAAKSVRLSAPEEDGSGSAEETVAAEVYGPPCSVTAGGKHLKEAFARVSKTVVVASSVRPLYFKGDLSEHVFAPIIG